ncbi:PrpF domain-containing protein [Leucothrix pacifica]|uniref:PrpF domain-containing protein n=1 Tax=Leucothrix pacifica TaxID=1247513 RepID=UPI001C63FA5A|nr:PrpF domain-containing protein [Leucothrix pacifica]
MARQSNTPKIKALQIPLYHMRGGTSTGVILNKHDLPADEESHDNILRKIMGVPESGHSDQSQITGLGRGAPTSNKLFIIEVVDRENRKVNSTLAQFAAGKSDIDWSGSESFGYWLV